MPKIQITEDGSHTLFSEMAGQTYHSSHGAVQESRHIFISQLMGRCSTVDDQQSGMNGVLSVLEIGFGTGLNVLLTAQWARENGVKVDYTTIELYPLVEEIYRELNYGQLLGDEELFLRLHEVEWDAGFVQIGENFTIQKCKSDIVECLKSEKLGISKDGFDVVFFDAFSRFFCSIFLDICVIPIVIYFFINFNSNYCLYKIKRSIAPYFILIIP